MDFTKIDRAAFSVGSFADEPDDLAYWLSQTPEDRLAGVEFLRRQQYGDAAIDGDIFKFIEITELNKI